MHQMNLDKPTTNLSPEMLAWAITPWGGFYPGFNESRYEHGRGFFLRIKPRYDKPFPIAHKLDEALKRFSAEWGQRNETDHMDIEAFIPASLFGEFSDFMLSGQPPLHVFHSLGD